MSTNLEEKRFQHGILDDTDNLRSNVDVIESKFNDALQRIENMKLSISAVLDDVDVVEATDDIIAYIKAMVIVDKALESDFISKNYNIDDILAIVEKYKDNRVRLINLGTNGFNDTDSIGKYYTDDTSKTVNGSQYDSSRLVLNDSFNGLVGVNKVTDSKPGLAANVKAYPGHGRSVFINMYDGICNVPSIDVSKRIPYGRNNIVEPNHSSVTNSTPFIKIRRTNKVYSFDFGIQYITKSNTVSLYKIDDMGNGSIIDTGFHYDTGAFVKRFFGNIIVNDTVDGLDIGYILENSEYDLIKDTLPEFTLRFSYDENYIYIYLNDMKLNRLTYVNDGRDSTFIRDINELMYCKRISMSNSDNILAIKNNYGIDITEEKIGILEQTLSGTENVYVIPNVMVNLSLKDNSFFVDDSIDVGSLHSNSSVLALPYNDVCIKTKCKSMFQLENVRLTDGNNIKLVSNVVEDVLKISNVGFKNTSGKYGNVRSCSDIIDINNKFIANHIIDGKPTYYHSRIQITTTIDFDMYADETSIPDYTIDEIGKLEVINGEYFFKYRYNVYSKHLNKLNITNAEDLINALKNKPIGLLKLDNIHNNGNIANISIANKFPLYSSEIGDISLKDSLGVLVDIDASANKSLISVETDILPGEYEFDTIVVKHVSMSDNYGLLGFADKRFDNDVSLENQAVMSGQEMTYHSITFVNFTNFNVYPNINNALDVSNIEFTIQPVPGYGVEFVTVNGDSVVVDNNRFSIHEISMDIVINVSMTVLPIRKFNVYVDSKTNCTIFPDDVIEVDEGSNLEFNITPTDGYYITNILVNGISTNHVSGGFVVRNISGDVHVSVECTIIPPEEYLIEIYPVGNCVLNPGVGNHTVIEGSDFTLVITPDEDYEIKNIIVDGEDVVGFTNTVTFNNLTSGHTIQVEIGLIPPKEFYITVTGSNFCDITPAGSTMVLEGGFQKYTVTPNVGYRFFKTYVDDVEVPLVNGEYLFENVMSNRTIRSVCEEIPPEIYEITVTTPANGTITPAGVSSVIEKTSKTFTITPNVGYLISKLVVDGADVAASSTYTFDNINGDHTITAVMSKIQLTVTASGSNCTVTPSSSTIDYGSNLTLNITANSGYRIDSATVNGSPVTVSGNSITLTNVTQNSTVVVDCVRIYHNITVTAPVNGTITPIGVIPVAEGTDYNINVVPNSGYMMEKFVIDGADVVSATGSYTFSNVRVPHTFTAQCIVIPPTYYSVNVTQASNCTVTPGSSSVVSGGNIDFTITPNTGYKVLTVKVDGVTVTNPSDNIIRLTNVTANKTVDVVCDQIIYTIAAPNEPIPPVCELGSNYYSKGNGGRVPFLGSELTGSAVAILPDGSGNFGMPTTSSTGTNTNVIPHIVGTKIKCKVSSPAIKSHVTYYGITPSGNGEQFSLGTKNIASMEWNGSSNSWKYSQNHNEWVVGAAFESTFECEIVTVVPGSYTILNYKMTVTWGGVTDTMTGTWRITSSTVMKYQTANITYLEYLDIVVPRTIVNKGLGGRTAFVVGDFSASSSGVQLNGDGSITFTNPLTWPAYNYNTAMSKLAGSRLKGKFYSSSITNVTYNGLYFNNVRDTAGHVYPSVADKKLTIYGGAGGGNISTQVHNEWIAGTACELTVSYFIKHVDTSYIYMDFTVDILWNGVADTISGFWKLPIASTLKIWSSNMITKVDYIDITNSNSFNNMCMGYEDTGVPPYCEIGGSYYSRGIDGRTPFVKNDDTYGTGGTVSAFGDFSQSSGFTINKTVSKVLGSKINYKLNIQNTADGTHNIYLCTDVGNSYNVYISPSSKKLFIYGGNGGSTWIETISHAEWISGKDCEITATYEIVSIDSSTNVRVNFKIDILWNGIADTISGYWIIPYTNDFQLRVASVSTVNLKYVDMIAPSTDVNYGNGGRTPFALSSFGTVNDTINGDGSMQCTGYPGKYNVTIPKTIGSRLKTKFKFGTIYNEVANGVYFSGYASNGSVRFNTQSNTVSVVGVVSGQPTSFSNGGWEANTPCEADVTYTITNIDASYVYMDVTINVLWNTFTGTLNTKITVPKADVLDLTYGGNITNVYYCDLLMAPGYTSACIGQPNCTVTPPGVSQVAYGNNKSYTITPNVGYSISKLIIDGFDTTAANSYNFNAVSANHTIGAIAAVIMNTVTITKTNCNISPAGNQSVVYGGNLDLTITPTTGYHISSITVDGVSQTIPGDKILRMVNITSAKAVVVTCVIDTFNIVATQPANGTITPTGTSSVNYNANKAYTITPTSGYYVKDLIIDGTTIAGATTYTFSNVKAAHTIAAVIEIIPPPVFVVTTVNAANVSITPFGTSDVVQGSNSQEFTITPAVGFSISKITVAGADVVTRAATTDTVVEKYTITNVQAHTSITATAIALLPKYHTITVGTGANYAISPATVSVLDKTDKTFTITPDAGYKIDNLVIDGVTVAAASSYTFYNVTGVHSIDAVISLIPIPKFNVTLTSGEGFTISPSGIVEVQQGNSLPITATPNTITHPEKGGTYTPYKVTDFVVNGSNITAGTAWYAKAYTLSNVQANMTVTAIAQKITYSVNFTSLTNCTVTPTYPATVELYYDKVFTITPTAGYRIKTIMINSVEISTIPAQATLVGNVLTLIDVSGNKNITVECELIPIVYRTVRLVTQPNCTYQNAGGTVISDSAVAYVDISVQEGTSFYVKCVPNTGYNFTKKWTGNLTNYQVTDGGTTVDHTFTNITSDVSFSGICSIKTFNMVATQPTNGSITPAGTTVANYGSDVTYTITPNSGYLIDMITIDGAPVVVSFLTTGNENGGTYKFTNVTANHTFTAVMKVKPVVTYTVDLMSGTGYSFTNTGGTTITGGKRFTVNAGTDFVVTTAITSGYNFKNLVINSINLYPAATYTIKAVKANQVVSVIASNAPTYDFMWSADIAYTVQSGLVVYNDNGVYKVYRALAWSYNSPPPAHNTGVYAGAPFEFVGNISPGNGTTTPLWNATSIYGASPSEGYIVHNYNNTGYRIYKHMWWTQNNEPGIAANTDTDKVWGDVGAATSSAWSNSRTYVNGDTCIYNSIVYSANYNNQGFQPDVNNGVGKPWRYIGYATGDISWVSTKTYYVNDVAYYNGFIYFANSTNTGKQPDLYSALDTSKEWMIVGAY